MSADRFKGNETIDNGLAEITSYVRLILNATKKDYEEKVKATEEDEARRKIYLDKIIDLHAQAITNFDELSLKWKEQTARAFDLNQSLFDNPAFEDKKLKHITHVCLSITAFYAAVGKLISNSFNLQLHAMDCAISNPFRQSYPDISTINSFVLMPPTKGLILNEGDMETMYDDDEAIEHDLFQWRHLAVSELTQLGLTPIIGESHEVWSRCQERKPALTERQTTNVEFETLLAVDNQHFLDGWAVIASHCILDEIITAEKEPFDDSASAEATQRLEPASGAPRDTITLAERWSVFTKSLRNFHASRNPTRSSTLT